MSRKYVKYVVSNASTLIALEQLDRLDLLEELFGEIVIPPSVAKEILPTVKDLPPWVEQRSLSQEIGAQILASSLGPGESEALSLALETDAQWVILDERRARRLAQSLNLPVIGTLGILLAAKNKELIPAIKPLLDALSEHDFYIATDLYEHILDVAEEGAKTSKPKDDSRDEEEAGDEETEGAGTNSKDRV